MLNELDTTYDADGNVTETVNKDRFNTDASSATGALGSPTSGVGARDSYTVNWYDLAGRTSATADYGTNGAVPITAPPAAPPGNATVTGTASAGSTTTLTDSSLTAPDGTYVGYQISIPTDSSYVGTVTGYVQSTHTLTFTPAAGASPSGDAYTLTPVALPTTYGYLADNVQTVTLNGSPTGGSFTLTFNGHTTGSIAWNATAATVESDLAALASVGSGNVAVTNAFPTTVGVPYVIRFMGTLAGAAQPAITAASSLTGGTSPTVTAVVSIPGGDAGKAQTTTDPRGVVALTDYNLLGQAVTTIAGFSTGVPTADTDQTTWFTYNGNGAQTSEVAIMPAGTDSQATDYVYGVTIGGGSAIDSNDLLGATEYPDPSTGMASASASNDTSQTYDADGETLTSTDKNQTVHTLAYNVLGQKTSDTVTTLGTGVDGTVRRLGFTYTPLGSIYQATTYSDTAGSTILTQDQFVYNGLDQETQEYQSNSGAVVTSGPTPTPSVQYAYAGPGSGQNYSRQGRLCLETRRDCGGSEMARMRGVATKRLNRTSR